MVIGTFSGLLGTSLSKNLHFPFFQILTILRSFFSSGHKGCRYGTLGCRIVLSTPNNGYRHTFRLPGHFSVEKFRHFPIFSDFRPFCEVFSVAPRRAVGTVFLALQSCSAPQIMVIGTLSGSLAASVSKNFDFQFFQIFPIWRNFSNRTYKA